MNKSEHGGTCKAERAGNRTEETVLTDVQALLRRLVDSYYPTPGYGLYLILAADTMRSGEFYSPFRLVSTWVDLAWLDSIFSSRAML